MKLGEIRRDGFYTDGERVFYKVKDEFIAYIYGDDGIYAAYIHEPQIEVEKVQAGQVFYNENIKVIDQKTIELNATTHNYFWKQFADRDEAEKYAKENGVMIFDIKTFNEYVSVEFLKNSYAIETINFKDLR